MPDLRSASRLRLLEVTAVDFTVAKFMRPLVAFMEERGCEVAVACSKGDHWDELELAGLKLVEIPFRRSFNLLAHWRAARCLLAHLRREPYDIVHAHTPIAALIARWAAWRARVPLVLYTARGFHFHELMPAWKFRLHVMLERLGSRFGHHIFTQSREDREAAVREGIAPDDGVTWIGNGVDLTRFDSSRFSGEKLAALRHELGLGADSPVVVMVSRVVEEKGLRELVEAAVRVRSELPEAQFLLVGSALESDRDNFEQPLRELIARYGLESTFRLAGARRDVPELLALSTVFTLPSYREGVPRSGIEAMAAGLPTVMTNIRGCREETVEGETGFLVPVRDSAGLAERLLELLRDRPRARRMGQAARARALEWFNEQEVLWRQWRVIERLLTARGIALPRPRSPGSEM